MGTRNRHAKGRYAEVLLRNKEAKRRSGNNAGKGKAARVKKKKNVEQKEGKNVLSVNWSAFCL